jgi:hypothetical protein
VLHELAFAVPFDESQSGRHRINRRLIALADSLPDTRLAEIDIAPFRFKPPPNL